MLTRQEKRTQKKVLEQRDTARTEVDALKAEVERLHGDVKILAAEEIRRVELTFNEQTRSIAAERDKAVREREALLQNFEGAIATKLHEVQQELLLTRERLHAVQGEGLRLNTQVAVLTAELTVAREAKDAAERSIAPMQSELASLKMEDAKALRKRLQAKSERVAELEREVKLLKETPKAPAVPATPVALHNMLSRTLRRRLKDDAPTERDPEAPAETAPPPAEPAPAP